jgi:hypothetical protein
MEESGSGFKGKVRTGLFDCDVEAVGWMRWSLLDDSIEGPR